MTHATINADLFRRAYMAVSTDPTRYYLNGVQVEPCPNGGALMIATDGGMMLVIRDPHGWVGDPGLAKMEKPTLAACKPSRQGDRTLIIEGDQAVIVNASGVGEAMRSAAAYPAGDPGVVSRQESGVRCDGQFPDWRRVIPSSMKDAGVKAAFNPLLLAAMGKALCPHENAKSVGAAYLQLFPTGGASDPYIAVAVGRYDRIDGFGVVMAIRDEPTCALPEWMAAL